MRILLVTPGLPPDKTGGIENYVQMIRRGLTRKGHEVTVLTQMHNKRLRERNVIQIAVKSGEFRGYANWAAKAWLREVSREYDVIHYNGFPGQILSLAPAPNPKVVHVHNSLSMEPEWWAMGGIRHDVGFLVASQAFRRASLVICPTNAVKYDVLRYSRTDPSKVRVIPNCVDTNFFSRDLVPDGVRDALSLRGKFVILYFGKLKKSKGVEDLCKAFLIVKRKLESALIIGGSSAASDEFGKYLRQEYPDVIFTGFVEDPRPYYKAADVFSIYTPGFSGGETFAIALAEAMSMGLPIVCSDNPIFHEVTQENAVFVRPQDPQALAEGLLELARDKSKAEALGRESRKIAEEDYEVMHVVTQLEAAYGEVQRTHVS